MRILELLFGDFTGMYNAMQRFEKFHAILIDKGTVDDDIWNMDETGFRIGCGKAHWVATTHAQKPLLLMDPDNSEHVSSVECISAGG